MTITYRGYTIGKHKTSGYVVIKSGVVISSQPSIEFAKKFIDRCEDGD